MPTTIIVINMLIVLLLTVTVTSTTELPEVIELTFEGNENTKNERSHGSVDRYHKKGKGGSLRIINSNDDEDKLNSFFMEFADDPVLFSPWSFGSSIQRPHEVQRRGDSVSSTIHVKRSPVGAADHDLGRKITVKNQTGYGSGTGHGIYSSPYGKEGKEGITSNIKHHWVKKPTTASKNNKRDCFGLFRLFADKYNSAKRKTASQKSKRGVTTGGFAQNTSSHSSDEKFSSTSGSRQPVDRLRLLYRKPIDSVKTNSGNGNRWKIETSTRFNFEKKKIEEKDYSYRKVGPISFLTSSIIHPLDVSLWNRSRPDEKRHQSPLSSRVIFFGDPLREKGMGKHRLDTIDLFPEDEEKEDFSSPFRLFDFGFENDFSFQFESKRLFDNFFNIFKLFPFPTFLKTIDFKTLPTTSEAPTTDHKYTMININKKKIPVFELKAFIGNLRNKIRSDDDYDDRVDISTRSQSKKSTHRRVNEEHPKELLLANKNSSSYGNLRVKKDSGERYFFTSGYQVNASRNIRSITEKADGDDRNATFGLKITGISTVKLKSNDSNANETYNKREINGTVIASNDVFSNQSDKNAIATTNDPVITSNTTYLTFNSSSKNSNTHTVQNRAAGTELSQISVITNFVNSSVRQPAVELTSERSLPSNEDKEEDDDDNWSPTPYDQRLKGRSNDEANTKENINDKDTRLKERSEVDKLESNLIDLLDYMSSYAEKVSESSDDMSLGGRLNNWREPQTSSNSFLIVLAVVPGILGFVIVVGVVIMWILQKRRPAWMVRGRSNNCARNNESTSGFPPTPQQPQQKSAALC